MSNWFVYIAKYNDSLVEGITNDLVGEESALNCESNWKTHYKIVWNSEEFENKISALSKLREISLLSYEEKLFLISQNSKLIILKSDMEIDSRKYPLIVDLRYTLCLTYYEDAFPELWKLNDMYMDCVCEYLRIKKTNLLHTHLWGISIDHSNKVGLITQSKFFPIIRS